MLFDLHVHTKISLCSELEIDDVLKHAKARGLDGVCITDHHSMEIRKHLREGLQNDGLCVIFGLEYSTADGDFLLFGPFENISNDLSATQLLEEVNRSGGAAIAAHPFRSNRRVSEHLVREGFCRIVESVNGRNAAIENQQVENWRRKYSLNYCGGSDAHSLDELGTVTTRFSTSILSRSNLIRELNYGLYAPEFSDSNRIFEFKESAF